MKRLRIFLSLIVVTLILFPCPVKGAVSDVDFDIAGYKIDAFIQDDGSMHVREMLTYDGSFNGQFWNLEYAPGGDKTFVGSLDDIEGNSPLYNAHEMTGLRVFVLKEPHGFIVEDNLIELEAISPGSGNAGDSGVYEGNIDGNKAELKIFSPTYDDYKSILIEYTLKNVVVEHNDVAEIYWNFIGPGWEDVLNDVDINIYLPEASEELRIFAHGPLEGVSEIVDDTHVRLQIEKMYPGEMLDARLVFEKQILKEVAKTTNVNALDEILRVEKIKADEANAERDKIERTYAMFTGLAIFIFLAMIFGTIWIYLKFDREKKSEFKGKYYRELPADYGPAVMSYNYYFKRISPRDLTATILNAIRKKVFVLEVKKIQKKKFLFGSKEEDVYTIVDNSNNINRSLTREEQHLKYWLINKIGDGKSTTFDDIEEYSKDRKNALEFYDDYDIWRTIIEGDALKYDFFDKKANTGVILGILLGFFGLGISIFIAVLGVYIALINIPLAIGVMIFSARIKKRTKTGNEDYVKWKAFSEFLTDFSKLDDAVVPSIILWEHYLVYAVSLGIADKVINTMQIVLKESDFNDPGLTFIRGSYGYGGIMAVNSLNTSLTNVTRSAVQSATTQHSSSTGGGGGFSSGGGGGGGGGSGGGGF
ncbi:DUF2207 domain-containing protein [Alkalibacter mobilis]|uniref:DUF2207 domain-containing protein n=1 Tax=Alkalibacter mobilis TaxID=2787712 RepID=UPI0018A0F6F8|nr:DUF2207 domain-containing protein [Alkalibacter mobilis]